MKRAISYISLLLLSATLASAGTLNKAYLGAGEITKAYLGSTQVFPHEVAVTLKDRLDSYWTMESSSSGRRNNSIGPIELGGAAVGDVVAGKIGNATRMTGANRLYKANSSYYTGYVSSAGRSVWKAGWFRLDNLATTQYIVGNYGGYSPSREYALRYYQPANKFEVIWCNDSNATRVTSQHTATPTAGIWYFAAFGRNDTTNEIWFSLTPDSDSNAAGPLTLASPTTQLAFAGNATEFGAQDSSSRMTGDLDEWGFYEGIYVAEEVDWLFNSGAGRAFADLTYSTPPPVGYDHPLTSEFASAADSRYSRQSLWAGTTFVPDPDDAGLQVMQVNAAWQQIQVWNNSPRTEYWAPITEFRITCDYYINTWTNGAMFFQLDGKSDNPDYDVNEGLALLFATEGGASNRGLTFGPVTTSGFNMPLNQWVTVDCRFNRNGSPNKLEVWIDDVLVLTGSTVPAWTMETYHHKSVGNDRVNVPDYLMKNFRIQPDSLIP